MRSALRCHFPNASANPRNMPGSRPSSSKPHTSMPRRSGSTARSGWRRAKLVYGRLLDELAVAAREAGEAILEIVRTGYDVEHKNDSSPVTEADRAAELIILAALARAAPGVP